MQTSGNWLAGSGGFGLLFVAWALAAIGSAGFALSLGKSSGNETDGCLLAIGNLVMSLVGAMVGLLFPVFPYTLLASMAGAFGLPGLLTLFWMRRTLPRR